VHVLRGVDLDINQGEMVAITGRSGSGKTTLLNVIGGLDSEWAGEVAVEGQDLHRMSDRALSDYRNQRVGFVFQAFHLLDHLSVLENAALPARFHRGKQALSAAAAHARARQVLEQVGLAEKLHAPPTHLSGGQKQRVAIARALLRDAPILVLDEATSALDTESEHRVKQAIDELRKDKTTLIVAHRLSTIRNANRIALIQHGKIRAIGAHDDLLASDNLYRQLVQTSEIGTARADPSRVGDSQNAS